MAASGDAHPSGDADTMPASSDADDPDHNRERRATIPDLAPPGAERYRLGAELGRGGMGRVVEAFDVQLGRTVAVKEVLPRGGSTVERRFEREVQITARLEHPSIVPLYDSGRTGDGRPFYVMRRVTGRPLDQMFERRKTLPERLALLPNLLAAIDAVGHAHRRGIIHRDLKPANILVGENGETIVIDWGLAKVIGEDDSIDDDDAPTPADSLQTQAGAVFGTPGFMPPEQARGEGSTAHGDVFALGATLYQLLAGRPPIGGGGPTDVIASTIQRRIVPIATAAPTAPAELHAIVEKALALEPRDRYADAERLADDVRAFLTGQLVAAHRYTRRERVVRYARRHRAPLSVAALALATLAVLAWIGVHRILVERDIARAAERDAVAQRKVALEAETEMRAHNDELMLTQARAQLDTNPTATLALMRDFHADSPKLPEARALAVAAVSRGVPWAVRAGGAPRVLELDRTATRLAEVTTEGALHVWDLETRRELYTHAFAGTAHWLADGRLLLVDDHAAPPTTLDVRTARMLPMPIGIARDLRLDELGARLAFVDDAGTAKLADVATGKVTSYWPNHRVGSVAVSPDGATLALTDASQTAIVDAASGNVLLSRPGELVIIAATDGRFAGITPNAGPIELARGQNGGWTARSIIVPGVNHMVGLTYRGRLLDAATGDSIVTFADGQYTGRRSVAGSLFAAQLAHGTEVTQTSPGSIAFFNDGVTGTLILPVPLSDARLASRRDHTRLAIAGAGLVLVYDLADVLPRFVPKDGVFDGAFIDNESMLMWPDRDSGGLYWYDVKTGARTAIDPALPLFARLADRDPIDGRALLYEQVDAKTAALAVAHVGKAAVDYLVHGDLSLFGILVPNGVLLGEAKGSRVLLSDRGGPPRELAKVEGGLAFVRALGRDRFVALGKSGELVRGALAGGAIDHLRIASTDDTLLASDRAGDAVIATGTRLDLWPTTGTLRPLAVLPRPIIHVEPSPMGLVVICEDKSVYGVELTGKVHQLVSASSYNPAIGGGGSWVAVPGVQNKLEIVELPSLARWSLPGLLPLSGAIEVAPTGRRLAATAFDGYAVFDLPNPGSDLAAWIDEHTNAFDTGDGALSWR
ncbi:MAG TPA: serine/threonine-protein kinase [Kofleriaceae bacterium]|nr:serine/threonine-protein kinase [Kofleriaceae bacterium]